MSAVTGAPATIVGEPRLRGALRQGWGFWRRVTRTPLGAISTLVILGYVVVAILAPVLAPYSPDATQLAQRLKPPSAEHWLGTDALGRDIFSRVLYGARVSLLIGVITVLITAAFGTLVGALGGFYRGTFDAITGRLTELLLAFPYLIFAIGMMAFLGPGFANLIWALSLKGWVEFYRLSRGQTLDQVEREYVEAARSIGQRSLRTLLREIIPNVLPSILVLATLRVGYVMVLEASLSFLGVGIPPNIPAWGSMIAEGRNVLFIAWWVSTTPGVALLILVLAINLLGERLQEIFDPKRKDKR